jgi:hypothetical protein
MTLTSEVCRAPDRTRRAAHARGAGRPLACQLSVASGIPLTLLLLRGLPQADGAAGAVDRFAAPYAALLFIMGMLVSWPQARAAAPHDSARGPRTSRDLRTLLTAHTNVACPLALDPHTDGTAPWRLQLHSVSLPGVATV